MVPRPFPPLRKLAKVASTRTRRAPTDSERNAEFLNRATNGYSEAEHQRLNQLGRQAWINEQARPHGGESLLLRRYLKTLPSIFKTGPAFYSEYEPQSGDAARELGRAALARAAASRWQLRERMVDFWHDHFSVYQQANRSSRLLHHSYDRDVIRPGVFGRFDDLLVATAKSPSMLLYLDGRKNVVDAPNENYAREVMELHTLGVDGPYTETDITELARALTGWRYSDLDEPVNPARFEFRANQHDTEAKSVLGVQLPAGGGVEEGEIYLRFLANHPKTIDFLSRKLVRRFVSESAPEGAVDTVKAAWTNSDGNLRAITTTLFSDTVSNRATPWNHPKLKRPVQFSIGMVRAVGSLSSDTFRRLLQYVENLGHRPFYWAAPNGYPDSSAAWSGDLHGRWTLASKYFLDNIPGMPLPDQVIDALRNGEPDGSLASRLNDVLTGGRLRSEDVAPVQTWLNGRGNLSTRDVREAISMLASSASYQLT